MNKVIFICLLSLSMCFSAPADSQVPAQQTAPVVDPKVTVSPIDPKNATLGPHNETTPEAKSPPITNAIPATNPQTIPTTPNSTTVDNKTDKQKADDKTAPAKQPEEAKDAPSKTADDKPAEPKGHEEKPAPMTTNSTDVKPNATDKPNSSSKPDEKPTPKPEVTTDKNAVHPTKTTETTAAPKTDDKKEVVLQSRGFDGPSFFGGIILTLGLLSIGFIGFKYYRTQTERNYHTL